MSTYWEMIQERVRRHIRREFPHAYMSNTKWRRMFEALEKSGIEIEQVVLKLIREDEPKTCSPPGSYLVDPPHAAIDNLCPGGPVEFREIEWLEYPAIARFERPNNVPARAVEQDLDAIESLIRSLGEYPVQRSSDAVRIIGYSR